LSFKVEIKVFRDPSYYLNQINLATREEAESYGQYKVDCWANAESFRVVESEEPVNWQWDPRCGLLRVEGARLG
jgi:hypothetical protein